MPVILKVPALAQHRSHISSIALTPLQHRHRGALVRHRGSAASFWLMLERRSRVSQPRRTRVQVLAPVNRVQQTWVAMTHPLPHNPSRAYSTGGLHRPLPVTPALQPELREE
jgi:hypothetical protein